ncbi:MAG: hypothetical protein OXG37_13730 [Actinomycetia bacterium]|nr:hypothetical protein [Actinomycetes bacterium]
MSVVARRIASVPRRTSVETWRRIVELVTTDSSDARTELDSVASVASSLIADEHAKSWPITLSGSGPFVRIYTLHGDDAVEADLSDEAELSFDLTLGESWLLSLLAGGADFAVATKLVAGAPHVEVRDVGAATASPEPDAGAAVPELAVGLHELTRP